MVQHCLFKEAELVDKQDQLTVGYFARTLLARLKMFVLCIEDTSILRILVLVPY